MHITQTILFWLFALFPVTLRKVPFLNCLIYVWKQQQESVVAQAEQTTAALLEEYATLEHSGSIRLNRSNRKAQQEQQHDMQVPIYSTAAATTTNATGGGRLRGAAQRLQTVGEMHMPSQAYRFMDAGLAARPVQLFPAF